ncbi:MAG: hypothetical protein KA144_09900 [Xanthomonadaceae bacterium]|nr:hypothetical protein [Xanthomonadaceae bacterium]
MRRLCALALLGGIASAQAAPNPMCVDRATYERFFEESIAQMPPGNANPEILRKGLLSLVELTFSMKESLSRDAERGDIEAQGQIAGIRGDCMLDGASAETPGDLTLVRWLHSAPAEDDRALSVRGYFEALGWDGQPASALRAYPHLLAAGALKAPEGDIDDRKRHNAAFDAVLLRLLGPRLEREMQTLVVNQPGEHAHAARIEIDRCVPSLTVIESAEAVDKARLQQALDGIAALLPAAPALCEGRARVPLTLHDRSR